MHASDSDPQTIRLLSLQCELSMCIGTSLDLAEMLHRFLVVLTQRLHARAAQVWWQGEDGTISRHAYPACSLEAWLGDAQRSARLKALLGESFDDTAPLEFANGTVTALRVGGHACVFIEHGKAPLGEASLAALRTLMPRLALSCQACFDHARSRALLDLTRLQNAELEAARERAEAASRSKSEFVAAITHEIRTPLNSIIGFAELLQLETGDGELHEYAKSIHASGRHLYAVFNDLLDLAKLNSDRLALHPEDIDLGELCRELWATLSRDALDKGLDAAMAMAPDVPARMLVDPVRLRQILSNLLANAIKYTARGRVEMQVYMNDGLIAFALSDTGPGIPPEAQRLVFERFRQVDNVMAGNHEGTGLGLAIALELAERMGGVIELSSQPGVGSTFTLLLPRVDPGLGVLE
ncbi:HAMP domain-containing sensor histidine kinase [Uliginosibacterium sp. 31-16]|uniref:sensor histidine kinase n=1 Tax=Uliginosibacterium sp. 31-16 TaxID=3068315 RepID=UPI00273DC27F|nr:HAMP domain-containing sensor histidine kinase [Uliginosibacterium sp. 31-16]MDP5241338.1 HAMP domain-containing sensor histidine kinase [Uliginosibacterium sp. 31-16]